MTENGVRRDMAGAPGLIDGSTATMAFDRRQPAGRVASAASERGLLAETCCPASGVVRPLPPLAITEAGLSCGWPASRLTRRQAVTAIRRRTGGLLSMREVRTEVQVPEKEQRPVPRPIPWPAGPVAMPPAAAIGSHGC